MVNAEDLASLCLRQIAPNDDAIYLQCKFCLQNLLFRMRKVQLRKNVSSARIPATANMILTRRSLMGETGQLMDRDKLRAAIRRHGTDYVFLMLDAAITLLPRAKLRRLAKEFLSADELRPDIEGEPRLLAEINAFRTASLAGKYYEAFAVNSRNFTETSSGTLAWMADCRRLLDRCTAEAKKGSPRIALQAFEVIFDLLERIDAGNDDIVFFADDGGSWALGIDWERVLPVWFRVLSAETTPNEYAQRTAYVLRQHYKYGAGKMLSVARRIATPAQRQALPKNQEVVFELADAYAATTRAAEEARRERRAAAARQRYLASIAGRESELWERIGDLISARKPNQYEEAVKLLVDLRDLHTSTQGITDFQIRLASLRKDHRNKCQFLRRLNQAGL